MFGWLAVICILAGLIVGIFDAKIAMDSLTWFVAAIAFNTLNVVIPGIKKKEP